jgi:hypothetical protein
MRCILNESADAAARHSNQRWSEDGFGEGKVWYLTPYLNDIRSAIVAHARSRGVLKGRSQNEKRDSKRWNVELPIIIYKIDLPSRNVFRIVIHTKISTGTKSVSCANQVPLPLLILAAFRLNGHILQRPEQ